MTQTKLVGLSDEQIAAAKRKAAQSTFFDDGDEADFEYSSAIPDPVTIQLKNPMKYKGEEYSSLTFEPFRGEHFAMLAKGIMSGASEDLATISVLTGTPYAVIKRLHGDDMVEAMKIIPTFLPQEDQTESEGTGEDGQAT